MIDIVKLLNEEKGLDGYRINWVRRESYELFFVHESLETVRATDTDTVQVTVYRDHDGKRGQASFKLYASTTEDGARQKIASALRQAEMINNEYFELPEGETFCGEIESNIKDYEPRALASEMARAVFSANMLERGSVNALEVFINKMTVTVQNSRGLDKREVKYNAMIEAIPTWTEGESVELYEAIRTGEFDFEQIKSEISAKMREVRDRGRAKAPERKLSCKVMLPKEELSQLIGELTSGLNYADVYSHSNPYTEGDPIQKEPKGDKISVTLRGAVKGSVASALFDDDGGSLIDTEVIRDGVAVSYYGAHRFAQYLSKPATGNLPCTEVKLGTLSDEELKSEPYLEVVSMSGLQTDVYSDYLGGEVRLAYYHSGGEITPITGISIAGKLSEALDSIRLSDTAGQTGRYLGPKLALIDGMEIL